MSTKQLVLYILMVFFLVVMLVAMGAWFKSSMELNDKKNLLFPLHEEKIAKDNILTSKVDPKVGLKPEVEDPQDGLNERLKKLQTDVPLKESNPDPANPGMKEREARYRALEPEVKQKW